jgi:RNA polymerase sigma-70 factor (ECF subfamily)
MMDELTRLAVAARDGAPHDMAAFIRASRRQVWSLCAHLVDANSADDLTQETYLRVFRALRSFRQDSSARTWLLSITRHVCMDELRQRVRRRRRDSLLVAHGGDEPAYLDDTDQIEMRELLSHLDTDRREAFALTQLIGLSYDEAATVSGCPVGTIRSRVARARADLITALGLAPATEPAAASEKGDCTGGNQTCPV